MQNLTLSQFNNAYQNILSQWGCRIESKVEDTNLILNLENNCKLQDSTKLVFNQSKMSIYTTGRCPATCSCSVTREKLLPLVKMAILD